MKRIAFSTIVILCSLLSVYGQGNLSNSWKKQNRPIRNKVLTFSFTEKRSELDHGYVPWSKSIKNIEGSIWVTSHSLYKKEINIDNIEAGYSLLQYSQQTMLHSNYGSNILSLVTIEEHQKQLYRSARYTPTLLLEYFDKRKSRLESSRDSLYNIYRETINDAQVRLFINRKTNLIDRITILENDDFLGDINTSFEYYYLNGQPFIVPQKIFISGVNGQLSDSIYLSSFKEEKKLPTLLSPPSGYTLKEEISQTPEISLEKYNDHIYFLFLKHTDSRSLVVNFKDFILVAEAPLNSSNGNLIIEKIRENFGEKPIRYFVAGHPHPHYLGGVRSFIHAESTILTTIGSFDLLSFLAKNPRNIMPDSLQLSRKMLHVNILGESRTVTDDSYSMEIINIGPSSYHTKDYLIFYFPKERLLFQGDLIWIPENRKPTDKISKRQKGLYEAIKKLNLNVETIYQSWPVKTLGYKTIVSFKELEETISP